MKLIFADDPMCSRCYGFVPEVKALAERHPNLPLTILVGGQAPRSSKARQ